MLWTPNLYRTAMENVPRIQGSCVAVYNEAQNACHRGCSSSKIFHTSSNIFTLHFDGRSVSSRFPRLQFTTKPNNVPAVPLAPFPTRTFLSHSEWQICYTLMDAPPKNQVSHVCRSHHCFWMRFRSQTLKITTTSKFLTLCKWQL